MRMGRLRSSECGLLFVLQITRASIDALKNWFRDEMGKSDWQLIMELKKTFEIIWTEERAHTFMSAAHLRTNTHTTDHVTPDQKHTHTHCSSQPRMHTSINGGSSAVSPSPPSPPLWWVGECIFRGETVFFCEKPNYFPLLLTVTV